MSNSYTLGEITIQLKVQEDNTIVAVSIPWGDLSVVEMLGMLELARDTILQADPEDGEEDDDE